MSRVLLDNRKRHDNWLPIHLQPRPLEVYNPAPGPVEGPEPFQDRRPDLFGILMPEKPNARPEPSSWRKTRRMYVPVDESGSAERWCIYDKATEVVLARCWGSHFHAWKEAIQVSKSLGGTDRDIGVSPAN